METEAVTAVLQWVSETLRTEVVIVSEFETML